MVYLSESTFFLNYVFDWFWSPLTNLHLCCQRLQGHWVHQADFDSGLVHHPNSFFSKVSPRAYYPDYTVCLPTELVMFIFLTKYDCSQQKDEPNYAEPFFSHIQLHPHRNIARSGENLKSCVFPIGSNGTQRCIPHHSSNLWCLQPKWLSVMVMTDKNTLSKNSSLHCISSSQSTFCQYSRLMVGILYILALTPHP